MPLISSSDRFLFQIPLSLLTPIKYQPSIENISRKFFTRCYNSPNKRYSTLLNAWHDPSTTFDSIVRQLTERKEEKKTFASKKRDPIETEIHVVGKINGTRNIGERNHRVERNVQDVHLDPLIRSSRIVRRGVGKWRRSGQWNAIYSG